MSFGAAASGPIDRKQQIMDLLRAGKTPAEIRAQLTAASKEAFKKKVEEAVRRSQLYVQRLNALEPFRQEARDFDFLAAGKIQVAALKERVQILQDSKKNSQGILDDLVKNCDESIGLNTALREQLQRFQKQLKDAPPVHGTLLDAGNRICQPMEHAQRGEREEREEARVRRERISQQRPQVDS
jgi:hypothetical protein